MLSTAALAASTLSHDRRPSRLLAWGLALYCLWAALLIAQNPGLQYDEALMALGSVHLRHSRAELTLPHDPDTWIPIGGRSLPLMTARYVGAIKEYICLPLFAVFGPGAEVLRAVSALLGLLGIWGLGSLIAGQVSPAAGAAVAWALALNPAYVNLTVFDNGTVAIWMGAMGLLCLAANSYLERKTAAAAFRLGAAAGLGIWARANFLWLLAAIAFALLAVFKGRLRAPLSHWTRAALGALLGGAPFLLYQVLSGGGTWQAFGILASHASLPSRLATRLIMLGETLLSDREHRAMWGAAVMPAWQRWPLLAIVLAACVVCLAGRGPLSRLRWARGAALCFLCLAAILFVSHMPVAEHHLIVLVPIAAVIVTLAAMAIGRSRGGRIAVASAAVFYVVLAVWWQVAAIRGLWDTGGVGPWSDAVFTLSDYLRQAYPNREIRIVDWGLQNNLYLLSDGALRSREIYGDATEERTSLNRLWTDEIRGGGVFLLNSADNRQFPAASTGFLRALETLRPGPGPKIRRFTAWQRNGGAYAEIFDIPAGALE